MVDNTTTHQVTVMATYPGDFNLDGVVNAQDEAILFANVFTGSTWQQGDANGDGVVNGLDRDLWYSHVGLPQLCRRRPAANLTAVPEPPRSPFCPPRCCSSWLTPGRNGSSVSS